MYIECELNFTLCAPSIYKAMVLNTFKPALGYYIGNPSHFLLII